MATESKAVEALRSKIRTYLRQKQVSYEVDYEDGTITARRGSTAVIIKPMEWGERTLVKLVAPVILSVSKVTPKLTRFLAEKNNQLLLGRFSLDTEDDTNAVWYEHVLLGDSLDAEELSVAVEEIATIADEYYGQVWEMARDE
jgi:hypothetical protein